jgi:probable F420-dependent oxidoreductase
MIRTFVHLKTSSGGSYDFNAAEIEPFCRAEALAAVARAAEDAGFYGVYVTDHPFPSLESLEARVGHQSLDVFVALSIAAAATKTLRLATHVLVLPYRNPFHAARSIASLDFVSGGRMVVGLGAGYMKGEFEALGSNVERRNELFDEGIRAMKAAWTEERVVMKGEMFNAPGNAMTPRPVQRPHPPLYIGGNSRRAARRAGEFGDGFLPFPRTPNLKKDHPQAASSGDSIRAVVAYAQEVARKHGRPKLEITGTLRTLEKWGTAEFDTGAVRAEAEQLQAEIGMSLLYLEVPGGTPTGQIESIRRMGERVLPKLC